MILANANKHWDDNQDMLLLAALEIAQKMGYSNTYSASLLHKFLGRTEKAVEIRLNDLCKPVGYEPKKRTKREQPSSVDGKIVNVIVTRVESFGAFCVTEDGMTSGLLHISKMANHFIKDVKGYVIEGDVLKVKIEYRDDNRIDFNAREVAPLAPKQNFLKVNPLVI